MSAFVPKPPTVVTHDGGKRFTARVRTHSIVTDQPVHAGGDDAGPSPLELLGAALGTCVALYVQQFCRSRNLPHDGMRVEVESRHAQNPNRIGDFAVRVILPEELAEESLALIDRVATSCPVHNTFGQGAGITIDILTGASV